MLLVVIIMFYNNLWAFSIGLPYFGYNSAEQENPILCIFTFQELSQTQIDMGFLRVDILPREAPGAQEFNETRPRGQTR
jgi:hypothetical protein